jgi:uncharacterized protein (DUF433 family)
MYFGCFHPIQITPGVCGGQARIRNTRIGVWTLVAYRKLGASNEELLSNYPATDTFDYEFKTKLYI